MIEVVYLTCYNINRYTTTNAYCLDRRLLHAEGVRPEVGTWNMYEGSVNEDSPIGDGCIGRRQRSTASLNQGPTLHEPVR